MEIKPPLVNPKIPPTIPLDKAGLDKQQEYAGLAMIGSHPDVQTVSTATQNIIEGIAEPASELPKEVENKYAQPTPEDKQAFVRSILGSKSFEKHYILFGQLEVILVDRTTKQTEDVYIQLDKDITDKKLEADTDESYQIWLDRYRLATTFREYIQPGIGRKTYVVTDKLFERCKELMDLPKPLYQALMQTNRNFEEMIDILTEKAQEPDFWVTVGAGSPLKRMSATR